MPPYCGAVLRRELQLGIGGCIFLLRKLRHRPTAETEVYNAGGLQRQAAIGRQGSEEKGSAERRIWWRLTWLLG